MIFSTMSNASPSSGVEAVSCCPRSEKWRPA